MTSKRITQAWKTRQQCPRKQITGFLNKFKMADFNIKISSFPLVFLFVANAFHSVVVTGKSLSF